MITGTIKNKIDKIWKDIWASGLTQPITVIEQITYLMFIRSLDQKDIDAEAMENLTGQKQNKIFPETPEGQRMRWSKFKDRDAVEIFDIIQNEVFPFIKEMTGDDTLRHSAGEAFSIDEEQEMFYNNEVLNLQYVYGTANFEPSSKEGRIKKFSFEVKANYTDTISKTWVIVCYLDPDAFVNSSSVAQYAVYTYNDEDMDGAKGAADDNYGIYDNDYANVASGSATLKNNFVSSQSEFQKNIIQAITDIMKDGTYKYYELETTEGPKKFDGGSTESSWKMLCRSEEVQAEAKRQKQEWVNQLTDKVNNYFTVGFRYVY